ncbi:MAG: nitrate reductase molybdenum cofactor assembly chaperone [Pirellulaceae bacterium]
MREELYTALAASLNYPQSGWLQELEACRELVTRAVPGAADHLLPLWEAVRDKTDVELEECFTQTFDHNPTHALEIGWHLFGEDYHRGALLVRLRQELRRHKIEESLELPDHLSHVLVLLGRMQSEEALQFSQACVVPAVKKLVEGLERNKSPYAGLLQCIAAVVDHSCKYAFEEISDGSRIEAT